jgi:hypothetical protein
MTIKTDRLKFAASTILIVLAVALAYTSLHEGGHALAGLVFGGQIGEFDVNFFSLGAHVNISGEFTPAQNAVINVSGVGLPLLVWFIFILALPKKASPLVQWTKFITSAGTLFSLLAWVIIPFLYIRNTAPAGDDVTQFLTNSGLPPLWVAFAAIGLFVAGWLFYSMQMDGLQAAGRVLFPRVTKPVPVWRWVAGVVMITGILAGAGLLAGSTLGGGTAQPPKGYHLAAMIDLSAHDINEQSIAGFNLVKAGDAEILLRMTGVDSTYIDVTLVPPQGAPFPLLHGESFSSQSSDSPFQFRLPAGDYQIMLSSLESSGILKVFLRIP